MLALFHVVQVIEGMDVVKTLAALPAVKDNSSSGYIKCGSSTPYHLASASHTDISDAFQMLWHNFLVSCRVPSHCAFDPIVLCMLQDCKVHWGQESRCSTSRLWAPVQQDCDCRVRASDMTVIPASTLMLVWLCLSSSCGNKPLQITCDVAKVFCQCC